jgi:hypothetical protein
LQASARLDVAIMTGRLPFLLAGYVGLCLDSPVFAVQHDVGD